MVAALALLLLAPSAAGAAKNEERNAARLAQARELIEAERPEEALEVLDQHLRRQPDSAEGLLLRSTAHIMLGDVEAGRRDLERSLKLDPGQRQGWLNLGALALARQDHDRALEAFEKAEELDPGAAENDLNIGAVLLLRGDLRAASERFAEYLEGGAGSRSEGYYLVATNYAMAGYAALALEHLERAIELDERARLNARTDPNFAGLRDRTRFQHLMNTDLWRPAPGDYTASRTFETPYRGGEGPLLKAVLDTLQLEGIPFDSRVEVTQDWALIQGEMRIKVSRGPEDRGLVEVSAEADRFSPTQWRDRLKTLFDGIRRNLLLRSERPGRGR